jgi:carboxyl-terminal processing protease
MGRHASTLEGFFPMAINARPYPTFKALAAALILTVTACSGGGGGGTPPPQGGPPPSPPSAGPTFTPNVFAPASNFKSRCAAPRAGNDLNGRPFNDLQGTDLEERFWLRSWTNETYLWNTEVTDQNPSGFADKIAYFNQLRTFARTPSGKEKDDFHFNESTVAFQQRQNSAPSATYGAELVAFSTRPPRDFRVQYTEPSSPASALSGGQAALVRGSRILRVNGIDLVNGGSTQAELDQLNAGLFPSNPGVTTTFVVRDPGASADRTVQLTSVNLSPKPVNRTRTISTSTGNVGYILFNTFSPFASEREIAEAINAMRAAGVNDVVLDLRYNGGGLLAVASQLSYMVAGSSRTSGRTFERLRFNAAAGNRNPVTGETNNSIPFYTTGLGFSLSEGTALQSLNLPRVFVLSTADTCSASEAVINGLRGIGVEVVLIGSTTCGKPFGFYPQDNCGTTYYTIQFQGVNNQSFGDYADGFITNNSSASFGVRLPGCEVADDYTRELGDPSEALLAAALQYRATVSCPAPPSSSVAGSSVIDDSVGGGAAITPPAPGVMETNRDMTLPGRPGGN